MERMEEHFFLINPVKNEGFFTTIIDPPMKGDKTNLDYYKAQLKLKVLDELEKRLGIDVSDEAMNIGKDFAYIVSKDEQQMVKEVKDILDNKVNKKFKKVDLEEIQKKRIKKIEELFDEVI